MWQNSGKGYFHLTPKGWVRQDHLPHPEDRIETWLFEPEPAGDAENQVCLTRVWCNPGMAAGERDMLRAKFAQPPRMTAERQAMPECPA